MELLFICSCFLIFSVVSCETVVSQCDNDDVTNYMKGQSFVGFVMRRGRLSSIHNPDYPFAFQFYVPLSDRDKDCLVVTRDGVVRSLAIKYAIHRINNNTMLNKWGKIGYQIDDVCDDLPTTMARGIEGISYHRPNSVCRDGFLRCDGHMEASNLANLTRKFIAVVGSGISFTAVPLGSLTSLYDIPHIDFSSTSEALNDREIYQSFFRTVPPDTYQIQVFLEMFRKFRWNYIYLVGSDDDYGKLAVKKLRDLVEQKVEGYEKICIVGEQYIPYQSTSRTNSMIESTLQNIKVQHKAKAVVLFMYVKGLGDKLLESAKSKNISRIWLTSEAWNPDALDLSETLKEQAHGILTVSIPAKPIKDFEKFMENDIKENWACNMWLVNFLKNKVAQKSANVTFSKSKNAFEIRNETHVFKEIPLSDVIRELKRLPAQTENMINAIRALRSGMHYAQEEICTDMNHESCKKAIMPGNVTRKIYSQQYTKEDGNKGSFRSDGTPNEAKYTISNLIWNGASYEYQEVGSWHNTTKKLILQRSKIQWPYWINESLPVIDEYSISDVSKCHRDCIPGEFYENPVGCCWTCAKCANRTVSTRRMSPSCTPCTVYEHPNNDQSKCEKSAQKWLDFDEVEGIAIITVSTIGIIISGIASLYLFRQKEITAYDDNSTQLTWIVCGILGVTYLYGITHIMQPSDVFCPIRNSIFYLLLMMYSALMLLRSKFITNILIKNSDESLGEKLSTAQLLLLLMLFLLELVSVVIWLYVDKERVKISRITPESILLRCSVDLSAVKLASIIIPCIVLLIATVLTFRERNAEHYFYEPKFYSFACIALCIIIIAFIPTFKYVRGAYTAYVMVFTMDVFGFTFLACVILPKVYVTYTRKKYGVEAFKLKPAQEKKKKDKKKDGKEKKKKAKKQESVSDATTDFTDSSKSRSSTKTSIKTMDSTIENTKNSSTTPSAPPMKAQPNDYVMEDNKPIYMEIESKPAPMTSSEITPSDIELKTQTPGENVVAYTNPAFNQVEPPHYANMKRIDEEKDENANETVNNE